MSLQKMRSHITEGMKCPTFTEVKGRKRELQRKEMCWKGSESETGRGTEQRSKTKTCRG
jgi:hypothetical protein